MTEITFLYVTAPDAPTAEAIGRALVNSRLAACVNILPDMQSIYRWDGAVQSETECIILVKTDVARAGAARDRICELHPYDTPCVAALPVREDGSNPAFLTWISNQVQPN